MTFNVDLAARFADAARILEVLGADAFRINALARAARAFEDHPADLASLSRPDLLAVPGVGPKIADKVAEFAASGAIAEFDELRAQIPPGLLDLLNIPGLGPKTVSMLWKQAGVTDPAGLKRIIDDGSILSLPRMGSKTVEKLRQSLAFSQTAGDRQNIGIVTPLAERLVQRLRSMPGVLACAFAGSLRRGRETVGDLDLLVESDDPAPVSAAFRLMPEVRSILTAGDRRSSVVLSLAGGSARWGAGDAGASIQADLRVVPRGRLGAALMYFTGSKDHNILLRELAQKKGLTLNEYGLFPDPGSDAKPDWSAVTPLAAATEEEVFAALGFDWIPPELREASGELDAFRANAPPRPALVDLKSIRAELHAHTTASDGRLTILELAQLARDRGFHTLAVTDHSRSSAQANGLSEERLLRHIDDVHRARELVPDLQLLAGSEVDILADGSLDYPDDLLRKLDLVVASPHASLSQDEDTCTARLLAAVRHPLVHILGHPTGRLINRRPGLSPRMADLFAASREHGVALEINSHWMRLDLRDRHVREAARAGCLLAIDCDVHEAEDFDNLRFGVQTARRGWLPAASCINTWTAADIRTWLARKRL